MLSLPYPGSAKTTIRLFTAGYEGRTGEQFIRLLTHHQIDVLLDVRHTPWSHKADFRQTALRKLLDTGGIGYAHLRHLGANPELRKGLKATQDWQAFAAGYRLHLSNLNGTVEATFLPYDGKRVCLLCMEANPSQCHRSLLASHLYHLGVVDLPYHL